jgi:formyltetrahydrofolate-dependent phosphoribosylglycinamide formyltransferase
VLVSGGGTNLQALLDTLNGSKVAQIVRVISNRPGVGALDRAHRKNIPTTVLKNPADASELLTALGDVQLVVLAGYLRLIPAPVVARFRGRIINVHPALLPSFGGPGMYGHHVHEAVLANGATQSGATVHFVDEVFDHGDIIAAEKVPVEPGDTPDTLAARVREAEHRLLPRVVLELARKMG